MVKVILTMVICAATLALGAGCDSDPADVAGDYSAAVTNRENGCMFEDWTEGEQASNIPVVVTQDVEQVTVTVNGGAGLVLDVVLGGRAFQGTVSGSNIEATIFGDRPATEGNCTWTLNAVLDARVSGDFMAGEIRYQAATNGNPDCAPIEGCATRQEINGNRPPQ